MVKNFVVVGNAIIEEGEMMGVWTVRCVKRPLFFQNYTFASKSQEWKGFLAAIVWIFSGCEQMHLWRNITGLSDISVT